MGVAASIKTQSPHSMTMTVRTIIGKLTASYQRAATSTLRYVMVGMVKCENNNGRQDHTQF